MAGAGRTLGAWMLLAAMAGLAGCGFKPLYGDVAGSVSGDRLAQVDVSLIPDRSGQILRNRLLTRMHPRGRAEETVYILDVDLAESSLGIAVERDETATRTNLTVTASIALTEASSGEVVFIDTVRSYASYDVLDAEYATLVAERDARERTVRELADRIVTVVALYLQRTG